MENYSAKAIQEVRNTACRCAAAGGSRYSNGICNIVPVTAFDRYGIPTCDLPCAYAFRSAGLNALVGEGNNPFCRLKVTDANSKNTRPLNRTAEQAVTAKRLETYKRRKGVSGMVEENLSF